MEQFNESVLTFLKDTVQEIEDVINPSIKESVEDNDDILTSIQTNVQWFQGKTNKGLDIRPFYKGSTIRRKQKKRQPFDRVTLRDSGDLYKSIQIEARDDEFAIQTPISYAVFLVDKYDDIFGLTKENLTFFAEKYIVPTLKKNIDDIIAKS